MNVTYWTWMARCKFSSCQVMSWRAQHCWRDYLTWGKHTTRAMTCVHIGQQGRQQLIETTPHENRYLAGTPRSPREARAHPCNYKHRYRVQCKPRAEIEPAACWFPLCRSIIKNRNVFSTLRDSFYRTREVAFSLPLYILLNLLGNRSIKIILTRWHA